MAPLVPPAVRALGALLLACALGGVSGPARGEDAPGATPPVGLEQLLRLPDSVDYSVERRGGETRDGWRRRFRDARAELAQARAELVRVQDELETTSADSTWKMAPPGLGSAQPADPDAPSNYKLSMDLRRAREDVARAERALRDLSVEANLAGVPEEWRE